jgi:D-threo-aldose 1-dehydrogenase
LFDPSKIEDADLLAKHTKWAGLAEKHGVGLAAVAVSFAALPAQHTKIVIGMATPAEVNMNLASLAERVPAELWHDASAMGLIDSRLPLPAVSKVPKKWTPTKRVY